ncbi:MAG: acetyl esterase [Mycobacterium sp.]|jgi:hypothetical protein|nr:acetyl esterase [Mycobacterium sp.]
MAAPTVNVTVPGRLGDPTMELRSDSRADPRMVAALAPFGLDARAAELAVTRQSPLEELLAVASATEQAFDGLFGALLADAPQPHGVETRVLTITGAQPRFGVPRREPGLHPQPIGHDAHGGAVRPQR